MSASTVIVAINARLLRLKNGTDVHAAQALAEERGVKAGTLIHRLRVALTGQTASPGIFDVMELLGRDRVLDRLHRSRK